MPHFEHCPWCNTYIWDWFAEWYLQPQKAEVESGRVAMDCPNPDCRRPVLWVKLKLLRAPVDAVAAIRPIAGAEKWATSSSQGYLDLVSFLTNLGEQDRAKYFRSGYWPQINV